ncbi:MAG: alpha-mannosidase [Bacteroidales bacterium]|nr:alpha-mannosidase [Bacteroidales bacterium]
MKKEKRSEKGNSISRRTFINHSSAVVAGIALAPAHGFLATDAQQTAAWPADAGKFRFHMIGQAHIDPVWLWPWSEGVSVVHSTFRSALDRMNENPDFCFTSSSAQFYEWVAQNDPSMLEEIRKRIDEGRWNITGGWWIEPDMNIPSGEAMVRQGLYGQLTLERLTGHRATVAYCPDSFGHANTVPQILRLQGMENYIFMRPAPKEKTIPADLFWWEGADGTRILTYRIQISYNDSRSVKNRVEQILTQNRDQPMQSFMAYYGAGDHGGGATKENIQSIEELRADRKAPEVFFSTTDRYFREIRTKGSLNYPVVADDLQHHAVGCYTAESEIKKGNRQSEAALVTAEKLASVAFAALGSSYPMAELTAAWKKVLFLQFHDSLAGTSLPEHSQSAKEGYGHALDIAHTIAYMSLQKLEWQVASEDPASQYLLVFNPHAWEVNSQLEYDLNGMQDTTHVEDENGNSLPHQWNPGSTETNRKRVVFATTIPPFGYRQIRIRKGDPLQLKNAVRAEKNTLENDFLRVTFSNDGNIGIFDKEAGKEVFVGGTTGCRAVVIDDKSDTWSHDVKTFADEIGSFSKAKIKIIEKGPLRAVIRVISAYGDSELGIDWILSSGSRLLEARVTLDWHEKLKMIKFSFPADIEAPSATYETPYGNITRETNGNEDPGQRWIDLTGTRGSGVYGLTVLNDAKYGYSVHGNDMRISIVRSSPFAHHVPKVLDPESEHIWMDQGIQTFRLLLAPHAGTWHEINVPRLSEEFISPSLVIYQGIHKGGMPKSGSFLSVNSLNVIITCVKQAENGEDIIFRCVETFGKPVFTSISLPFVNKGWTGDFGPYEIKTLRYFRKSGGIKVVNLLEE